VQAVGQVVGDGDDADGLAVCDLRQRGGGLRVQPHRVLEQQREPPTLPEALAGLVVVQPDDLTFQLCQRDALALRGGQHAVIRAWQDPVQREFAQVVDESSDEGLVAPHAQVPG